MTGQSLAGTSRIDYAALGDRLRAHRLGLGLQAEDIAAQLGVSRAVVYRLEKGALVKIETLERLAALLGSSMASLLGVQAEYYSNAVALFERMRQVEQVSERILAHFEPISLLLTSDGYLDHLRQMLLEGLAGGDCRAERAQIEQVLAILRERREFFEQRQPHILSLIGLREIERFVHTGLVGRIDLPDAVRAQRVQAARAEVLRIADLMERQPWSVQIGLVEQAMPSATFQVLSGPQHRVLMQSPFRLGELPNVRNGIATVTAAPEAVDRHENLILSLWHGAAKGQQGADRLRQLVERLATCAS